MSLDLLPVHSLLVRRAAEEHVQFGLLEHNYASVGGSGGAALSVIASGAAVLLTRHRPATSSSAIR
jgi:hypothetical protein